MHTEEIRVQYNYFFQICRSFLPSAKIYIRNIFHTNLLRTRNYHLTSTGRGLRSATKANFKTTYTVGTQQKATFVLLNL